MDPAFADPIAESVSVSVGSNMTSADDDSRSDGSVGPLLGRSLAREPAQGQAAFGTESRIVAYFATAFGAKHGPSSPVSFSFAES